MSVHSISAPTSTRAAVTARENSRLNDGRFGVQERAEALLPDLMAAAESLHLDLTDEIHRMGVLPEKIRSAMNEALQRHERRVFEILSGHDRVDVDGRSAAAITSAGYELAETDTAIRHDLDPHINLSPRLVDDTTTAIIGWRGRNGARVTAGYLGSRLRLQAHAVIAAATNPDIGRLNRAQAAQVQLVKNALADAETASDDQELHHEAHHERLAQVLTRFAPRI